MQKKWYYFPDSVISWFESYWFLSFLIAVFIACFIFYISSIPASGFPAGGLGIKTKFYHLGIYFLLGFFLAIAIIRREINTNSSKYLIIMTFLIGIAYAISDELHQFFVPGRHTAIADVFIDTTGILIAIVLYYALREITQHQKLS